MGCLEIYEACISANVPWKNQTKYESPPQAMGLFGDEACVNAKMHQNCLFSNP